MSLATKEALLGATKRRYRTVPIEGVGEFRIRSLTERERSNYEASLLSKSGGVVRDKMLTSRRRLIALTLVDESGNLLLSEEDVERLEDVDSSVTVMLWEAARDHCGFTEQDIEDAVGNSERIHVD